MVTVPSSDEFVVSSFDESVALPPAMQLAISAVFRLISVARGWQYPRTTEGDFPTMRFIDKLYWLYKVSHPVCRGARGQDIESFFARQHGISVDLPAAFLPKQTISLSAVGDLIQHPALETASTSPYARIAGMVFGADVSFANLESPLTRQSPKELRFSSKESPPLAMPMSQFAQLKGDGSRTFSVMATACNHALDFGDEGVSTTLETLDAEGITAVGTNRSREEMERGSILEVNGIRLGFVALTFGVNGKPLPTGKPYAVNMIPLNALGEVNLSLLQRQIAACRHQKCDIIIASLHWGLECELFPATRQIALAHRIAELGVDLILGHHPHVIQPVEYYCPQRDPLAHVPIYYSLGNLSNPFQLPHFALSLLAQLRITKGMLHGVPRTFIHQIHNTPLMQIVRARNNTPSISFESLRELLPLQGSDAMHAFINTAAGYADLVLGDTWRT